MISLITGVPGSGKSLKAVAEIKEFLAQGRAVYSDIDGLNLPGVLPAPDDWRDTPEGSVVVYDEAQKKFPSTGRPGVAEDPRIRALETHRHTGHDIYFITQSPALVHHHIRKLVGRHVHVHRAAGLRRATLFTWDFAVEAPNDRREQQRADVENWHYPKSLFAAYKSATVHTHKFQIPKKIAVIVGVVVVVVSFVVYRLIANDGFGVLHLADVETTVEPTPATAASERPAAAPPPSSLPTGNEWAGSAAVPAVIGCVGTETTCRCFGEDGFQLDLDLGQCLNVLHKPLPINVLAVKSSPAPAASSTPPASAPIPEEG